MVDNKIPVTENKVFDEPIVIPNMVFDEPTFYVGEKPYSLMPLDFHLIESQNAGEFRANIIGGATAGYGLSIFAKIVTYALNCNYTDSVALSCNGKIPIEKWELIAVACGIVLTIIFKKFIKSDNDKKRDNVINAIQDHFEKSKPRKFHGGVK